MANPIVNSLPAYVDEQRLPLIAKTILGAKTAELLTLVADVKSKTALNLISTDVVFGDGAVCGWNDAGTATLSQRYIDPTYLKVNMSFCDKALLGKWASYTVSLKAGKETLPFEEDFVNGVLDGVSEALEKMIWQGKKADGNSFDGFLEILKNEGTAKSVVVAAGTGAYEAIKAVYKAIPSEIVMKEDTVIFVSEATYRDFISDLVSANLYHFNPDYKDGEYKLPGTNVRVIAVGGLNGSKEAGEDKIVAGRLSNMFYGVSAEDDDQTFKLWYSADHQEFRLAINFAAGVNVAYPDEIVYSKDA